MKFVLLMVLCLSPHFALAQEVTDLKKGDVAISQAVAELISAKPICPQDTDNMSCMAYGTKVIVKIQLNGCLDNFGGYFTHFEAIKGRGILYIGAININNQASLTARCFRMPNKKLTFVLPYQGDIEVINLDYTGATITR